ncbi:MAG TPA: DUF5317 family protein [Actinomycetota bacterium]|nr:DUF5317 family protein [Actinomycetota bacterium]
MSTYSFTLALLAGSVGIGYLLGGRLSNLLGRNLRWLALALAGFALQSYPVHAQGPAVALLLVSLGMLFVFGVANLGAPGIPLLCLGLLMNFAVIAANSGMPVPRASLSASGQEATLPALEHSTIKHHLAGPGDVLMPLADVVAIGPPVDLVFSPGDLAAFAGMAWLVIGGMRRKYSPRHVIVRGPPVKQRVRFSDAV